MNYNRERRELISLTVKTLATSFVFAVPALASPTRPSHQVNNNMPDGFLNMRQGPGVHNCVNRKLYPGVYLVRHRLKGRWMKVSLLNDHSVVGWVHVNYIRNLSRVGPLN